MLWVSGKNSGQVDKAVQTVPSRTLGASPKLSLTCHFTDEVTEHRDSSKVLHTEFKGKHPRGKSDQRGQLGDLLSLKVSLGTRYLLKEGHDQRHKATMAEFQAPKVGDLLGNFGMKRTS